MKFFLLLFFTTIVHRACGQIDQRNYFSPEEIEGYNKVAKHIHDTFAIESYHFNKKKLLMNLRNPEFLYQFRYKRSNLLSYIGVFELDSSRPNYLMYYKEIFFNNNERIVQITDYFSNGKNKVSYYREDDGSVEETRYFTKNKLDGEAEKFYRNGKLKTKMLFTKDKVVTIEEFEENGKKVEATRVENGNGYWLECNPEGGYCCECFVVKGKLKNCQSLNTKKPLRRKN